MSLTPSQKHAVESSHEPLFIQAGAGTGKTFTLAKRIARGLSEESGPLIGNVMRLLTITFTNKAAGELVGRIRSELRQQGLDEQALQIDAAWISTIHAMCRRMLQSYAFDAEIDPGANLLTEEESNALSALALDALFQENAGSAELALLTDHLESGAVVKIIDQLSALIELAPHGADSFCFGPAPSAPFEKTDGIGECHGIYASGKTGLQIAIDLLVVYEHALEELETENVPLDKKTYAENHNAIAEGRTKLVQWLAAVDDLPPNEKNWALIANMLKELPSISKRRFKEPFGTIFSTCRDALLNAQVLAECSAAYERLAVASFLAGQRVKRHRALKHAEGALDTNDLLIGAYKLLESREDIASAYRDTFDSVMVDEFQDTDDLQVGIITHVCDESLETLATVGDAQQSIYGFRGADLEVYQSMRASMREHGALEVDLAINFRSQPDILRFVEDIFSKSEFFGTEFLKVEPGRDGMTGPDWLNPEEPRVKILLSAGSKGPEGKGKTSVYALRMQDARALADEFERLHAQGAPYGSMAVLMQSTKAAYAGPYMRELRNRGIPCIVSGGSDFFLLPEVFACTMLLRVLANRDDDEALFALLGSNVFNIGDDELLELSVIVRQKLKLAPEEARAKPSLFDGMRFYVREKSASPQDPVAYAYRVLEQALKRVPNEPLAHVVRGVVKNSGYQATLQAQGIEGGAVFANIERFCDLIEDHEILHGHAPFATSQYFNRMLDLANGGKGARAKLGTLVSSGQDAVQIMTIHSSKGLEFPIVAVAEFEKNSRSSDTSLISLTEDAKRYISFGVSTSSTLGKLLKDEDIDPSSFENAKDVSSFRAHAAFVQKERDQQELQRLFYVALTRARDVLIICAHDSAYASTGDLANGLTSSFMNAVFEENVPTSNTIFTTKAGALVELDINAVPYTQEDEPIKSNEPDLDIDLRISHLYCKPEDPPHIKAYISKSPHIYSYSSIAKAAHEQAEQTEASDLVPAMVTLHDRAKDAETVSAVGSAFHLVAQWLAVVPRVTEAALEQRLLAAVRRFSLDDEGRTRLVGAVRAWVASERFEQSQQYRLRYAEYPFCVDIQGVPLEGYIDLLCLDPDQNALIIDYKTGMSGTAEELEERYMLQASCYAYALLSSDVCEVVELVFVRPEVDMQEIVYKFSKADVSQLVKAIMN